MSHWDRYRSAAARVRGGLAGAVFALACLSWAGPAGPDDGQDRFPDLYTVRVTAEDRADPDLALARAMRAMLVRLTGLRRPEESPGVRDAFATPERFVQQYFFEPGAGHGLIVKFDPGAVDRLVEQLGSAGGAACARG